MPLAVEDGVAHFAVHIVALVASQHPRRLFALDARPFESFAVAGREAVVDFALTNGCGGSFTEGIIWILSVEEPAQCRVFCPRHPSRLVPVLVLLVFSGVPAAVTVW
jgi:hypothetical protein